MNKLKKIIKIILGKKIFFFFKKIYRNEIFVSNYMLRSWSDNGSYVSAVKEATDNYNKFTKFKSDSRYNFVLEHATFNEGVEILKLIKKLSPHLLKKII